MMQNKILIGIGLLLISSLFFMFTVNQTEKAIMFKFGEIVRYDYEPGLHFKVPVWNNIKKFDNRIQTMDSKPEQFLTAEKKNVIVDSFVKWRIDNVTTFYKAVGGDVYNANLRLDPIIKNAFRGEFSKRNIQELVSSDRKIIRDILIKKSQPVAKTLGMEIIDVQVIRIDLPPEVSNSVYRRMEAERERVAREFRSQGSEAAEKIRANADRLRVVTLANAYKDAETLRGEGDAKSAEIYAKAYGADTEFFTFYRSLNAYRNTFSKTNTLVIDPDSDFFRYFKQQK
ncbi:MAG: protease modulator HflC [Gammaproteobacteria bacterium]